MQMHNPRRNTLTPLLERAVGLECNQKRHDYDGQYDDATHKHDQEPVQERARGEERGFCGKHLQSKRATVDDVGKRLTAKVQH